MKILNHIGPWLLALSIIAHIPMFGSFNLFGDKKVNSSQQIVPQTQPIFEFKPSKEEETYWQELPKPPSIKESINDVPQARITFLNDYFRIFNTRLSLKNIVLNFIAINRHNPILVTRLAQPEALAKDLLECLERHKAYANFMPMILYNDVVHYPKNRPLLKFSRESCAGLLYAQHAGGQIPPREFFLLLKKLAESTCQTKFLLEQSHSRYYKDLDVDIFNTCLNLLINIVANNHLSKDADRELGKLLYEIKSRCDNQLILDRCSQIKCHVIPEPAQPTATLNPNHVANKTNCTIQ